MEITIRSAEPADAAALKRVHAQPRAVWGTLQMPHPSVAMWRKRLEEPPEGLTLLVACAGDEVVACLGLFAKNRSPRRRHVGKIGMAVHDEWHGRGVGGALLRAALEQADRWLGLTRLELTVYVDNEPAVRLYKRHGFEVEGTLRNYSLRDGEYQDVYTMARLRAAPAANPAPKAARAAAAGSGAGEPSGDTGASVLP